MTKADSLVVPSLWEGAPTVILEAMAASLPILATNVGDIPYMIQNGIHGILVERNVTSISRGLTHLLNNGNDVERMGMEAKKRVKKFFDSKHVANQVEKAYRVLDKS